MNLPRLFIGLLVLFIIIFLVVRFTTPATDEPEQLGQTSLIEQVDLVDRADTDLVARITTSGDINSDEEHRGIRISVSNSRKTVEILEGYQQKVAKRKTFPNNEKAYAEFLRAIDLKGFTERNEKSTTDDERGYCPTQRRTVYEFLDGGTQLMRLWSGSCTSKYESFDGDERGIENLFKAQIPDYRNIVKGVRL